MASWLLQFTVDQSEVKQNRKLPKIALFDADGNPIDLSGGSGSIPTWAPTTAYSLGQVVINSGHLYQAVDAHTSGAVFGSDSAHWTALDSETDALALAQLATHAGLTTTAHGGVVAPSLVDAKGDLIVGSANDTVARKAAGSNGKFLSAQSGQSDGLLWDDPVLARTSITWTTGSLANNASENDDEAMAKACQAYSITTDRAARVRAYSTSAHRTADAARAAGTDPTGNHGCLLDVVLVAGTLTIDFSPLVNLVNLDGTPATTIYFAVTNTSGSTSTVQVTITYRKSE